MKKNSTALDKEKVSKEKILTDVVRKDIEKSYKIDNTNGTEAYFSNRYGWTLRKSFK
tara:strand:- start:924 stop:1094 length:171 start_codon:yes stop_codon:yes gene_type:complete